MLADKRLEFRDSGHLKKTHLIVESPDGTNANFLIEYDRNAPAGSENSLDAESVREERPSTDDNVVRRLMKELQAKSVTSVAPASTVVTPMLSGYSRSANGM
jgi:hypothetical protein